MRLGPPLLYAATAGGLAVAARAAFGASLALPTTLAYLGAYVGLVAVGSMAPGLAMWGPIVNEARGGRGVALTFDDGPHALHTRTVARALSVHDARATFFAIGEKVGARADVVRELRDAGHEIGIHGHRVDRLLGFRSAAAAYDDLARAVEALEVVTGARPTLFRPPYGVTTPGIARAAHELSLTVVGWSARALDGLASATPAAVERRVLAGARDGAIVCMHDAHERGESAPAGVAALPRVLDALLARGLACVPISALLASSRVATTVVR